jgi:hypothetical protein
VLHLDIDHGDILEFINTPRAELPWAKRCVNIWEEAWAKTSQTTRDALLAGIARGDIWLAKVRHNQHGRRIYANVCLEVFLESRGTCLLEHINVAACEVDELPQAFADGMTELIELHAKTNVDGSGEYLSPEVDRQVGLGVLGLANLLSLEGVTYKDRYFHRTSCDSRCL